ncbi:PREDICTED: uncharacterized protein LOC109206550 [Nicotiana attenuata]|uniref:uncharacterized protein LOC109206550 n=1 Tax=Nicotiana attenuata TaxID=49451 RepID=UPI000904BDBC|nr:PREDICTED: uncharacterized protein LOC109206550 [Nicotiana attenuata]
MIRKEHDTTIKISGDFININQIKAKFGRLNTDGRVIEKVGLTVPNPTMLQDDPLATLTGEASVDPTLAANITAATTAKAACDSLHTAYANKSQTRIFSLRDRLSRLTKESFLVTDYLNEVRSLYDELPTTGEPITNSELIVKILTGLGAEYREISVVVRAHFPQTHALPHTSTTIITAVAQKTNSQTRTNTITNNRSQNNNQQNRSQPWSNRHANQQDNNLVCQLCNRIGHSAQQPTPWIVDTGATHHVASDAQSLTTINDYNGPEEIAMGNSNTIPISHTCWVEYDISPSDGWAF